MINEPVKKHKILIALLGIFCLLFPVVILLQVNVWLHIFILYVAEIAVWIGFVFFIKLTAINEKEISEQADSMDDILNLAHDKCMEARTANKSKSEFLSNMSHEIRTPINAVLGMNEMILRESTEENIINYASNAYNAGKALLSIINDVLDISKIEAGKMEIVESEYELYSLVSDCYHMTADRADKKCLTFNVHVDEELPSKFRGDMFRLRQITVNFLTNAVKYTDNGSVNLTFSGKQQKDNFMLKVSVEDTGIGLTKDSLEKLFTSFQRFDLKRNQAIEGTGLGLSICKQLTDLMNGEIIVDSVYGEGSTFTLIIPQQVTNDTPVGNVVLDRPAAQENIECGKVFRANTARVLVVDDVEMNLVVFTSLLKRNSIIIDEALNGKQCLEMVKQHKYDVIFMDHMMPEMDGMETFANMKKMEHLNKDTPVVMLTANAISGEKEKYLEAGFVSYLTKPIQSDKLEDALLKYIPEDKIVWEDEEISDDAETAGIAGINNNLIDTKLGISFAGGNTDAYIRILTSYVNNGMMNPDEISKLLEKESWNNYITKVHALKSTSYTIGAKNLSEMAKELEAAGKSGNYEVIHSKNDAMLKLYRDVLEAGTGIIRQWEEDAADNNANTVKSTDDKISESPEKLPELTEDALITYKERLDNAVSEFDDEKIIAICSEISEYLYKGTNLSEKFAKVKDFAYNFDYEQAGEQAEQIFSELLT